MKKLSPSALVFLVLLLSVCQRHSDITPSSAITIENLAGKYRLVSVCERVGTAPEVDKTADHWYTCMQDNIITLKADYTYTQSDVGIPCDPPRNITGNWSLPNEESITIDMITYDIISFDGKTLRFASFQQRAGQNVQVINTIAR